MPLSRPPALFAAACTLVLATPAALSLLFDTSATAMYGLAATAFAIEYGAAAAGIALGMHPAAVFVVVNAVSLGVVLGCYACLDALAERSPRLESFARSMAEKCCRSRWTSVYGPLALVPGMLVLGFYVCAPAAWCLGWTRRRAIAAMIAGEMAGSLVSMAAVLGVFMLAG